MCIHCGAPGDVSREDVERQVAEAADRDDAEGPAGEDGASDESDDRSVRRTAADD